MVTIRLTRRGATNTPFYHVVVTDSRKRQGGKSLEQVQKMGGIGALMDKLPSAAMKGAALPADGGDKDVRRQIAIINSMTRKERRNPGLLDGSRRRRIAAGAGVQVQDVNKLMKQFMEMQKMMKSMAGGRMKRMMQAFKGGMPPGF